MNRFPLADVLWTLAMAIDVFLIVFYKYDTEDLHKLEKRYIAIITTVVFIPAVSFLFVHTKERGPMYGSVTVSVALGPVPKFHLTSCVDLVFNISSLGALPHLVFLWTHLVPTLSPQHTHTPS